MAQIPHAEAATCQVVVSGETFDVTICEVARTVFVAKGTCKGREIETTGGTRQSVLAHWRHLAGRSSD
ncbi:hypothetical protein WBP07_21730 (plasmid) [Novosphingobium sp. BL-8A]|uniref:hypothetical protein n=1 Tax=Novosphingobium sp. BL-8A TaxID=3127639 RepID=UPI00375770C0